MTCQSAAHRGVTFLIRSLDVGGAEKQLSILARGLKDQGIPVTVVTFYGAGVLADELTTAGIRVVSLGKKGRWDNFRVALRLIRFLRNEQPAILHGYLGLANIISVLIRPFLPHTAVVWGLRASNMLLDHYDWTERLLDLMQRILARYPDMIVANSVAGREYAIARGYPSDRTVVVANGIDVQRHSFRPAERTRLRSEWQVDETAPLIAAVARLDPMKDYPTLLQAISTVRRTEPRVRLVCVGDGSVQYAQRLKQLTETLGLTDCVDWLGNRPDVPAILSACDLAVSSSISEGFSNAIAEAMACERPCVVTDVGDSRLIVGDTGLVVPPGDPMALAEAIIEMIGRLRSEGPHSLGQRARARIVANFDVHTLVDRTLNVFARLPHMAH